MVRVGDVVRCGSRRHAAVSTGVSGVVNRAVRDVCRDRIPVVNVRQKPFDRSDDHADEHEERAGAAKQETEWLSPTRHNEDTGLRAIGAVRGETQMTRLRRT